MQTKRRWRYGVKRWIVLGLFVAAGFTAYYAPRWYGPLKPIIPSVSLASEEIWPGAQLVPPFDIGSFHFPGIPFTNTVLSTLLTDLVLLAVALVIVQPFVRGRNPVPSKVYTAVEMVVESFWHMVNDLVGTKWVWRVFPIVMTIFLLILTANWMKMVPGYETFGWLREVHGAEAEKAHPAVTFAGGLWALDGTVTADAGGAGDRPVYELVPFLRGSSTDIGFPASMALFAVSCIFVFGFWSHGIAFLGKYFPLRKAFSSPTGFIDLGTGLLEFLLEFVKVISLTLRLFGNIFAGGLLLLIVGSLMVVGIPALLAAFELFVGTIQAYVFALLTAMFIQMAMAGHDAARKHAQ